MIRGLYTAPNGMIASQKKMDIISNNLANVNTTGFKKDGVSIESFADVLAVKVNDTVPVNESIGKMTFGAKVGSVYTNFSQGAVNITNNPLNIAIEGEGMLTVGVLDKEGNVTERYTRDGSFTVDPDGTLRTKEGNYILGEEGNITISESSNIFINENGEIFSNNEYVDKLKLTEFENPESLRKIGDNLYAATEETNMKDFSSQVMQGFLEGSNVNTVREMVDMISIMRGYEANQKVIQTQDESLGKAVNDIGRV